jgi:acyl-CoA thioesterase-2
MTAATQVLRGLLNLEQIEQDIFRGQSPHTSVQRVFGGQVAAQALAAAGRTVADDRLPHSLHAYFVRPGDPSLPIVYRVTRIRDGGSFATRWVTAVQRGATIFTTSVSFQQAAPGPEHQIDPPPIALPPPSAAGTTGWMADVAAAGPPEMYWMWDPFDIVIPSEQPGRHASRMWLRAAEALPDDPFLHATVLTYATDLTLLPTAALGHDLRPGPSGGIDMKSLDHAVWFHRPFRADEWLLFDQHSPSMAAARGLATGQIFTEAGVLIASVVQEGLIRLTDD